MREWKEEIQKYDQSLEALAKGMHQTLYLGRLLLGVFAVGLYPDLARNYEKYIKGLEMILKSDRTNRTMPNDVNKMELWMGDLFAKRYKPMEVNKKAPRDTPRPTKLML